MFSCALVHGSWSRPLEESRAGERDVELARPLEKSKAGDTDDELARPLEESRAGDTDDKLARLNLKDQSIPHPLPFLHNPNKKESV